MFRHIRSKMIAAFAVPLVLLVTGAALGASQIAHLINQEPASLRPGASHQELFILVLDTAGILAGLLLVLLVSRSVARPLVDLVRQAEELANKVLPETVRTILEAGGTGAEIPAAPTVTVKSSDEVAEMARALEAVNKTAVEMAVGQAEVRHSLAEAFVNLGRRNQNLVTRQLEYLSEIELKEADPDSLEELFRLDHLATRMRRNAESLLILAGSGPARQWAQSVPAMDVARAASAEVEDYKRLRLHHFDAAMVTGAVTTDLVHILAELIENALTFSPPAATVDIYGRFLEGGYVIVIVDSGIGIAPEELAVANRRLAGQEEENKVPGRYLGHYVAGKLAARHAISISLQASHSGGVVARVKLPIDLVEDPVPDLSAQAELAPTSGFPPAPPASPARAHPSYALEPPAPPASMAPTSSMAPTAPGREDVGFGGPVIVPSGETFESTLLPSGDLPSVTGRQLGADGHPDGPEESDQGPDQSRWDPLAARPDSAPGTFWTAPKIPSASPLKAHGPARAPASSTQGPPSAVGASTPHGPSLPAPSPVLSPAPSSDQLAPPDLGIMSPLAATDAIGRSGQAPVRGPSVPLGAGAETGHADEAHADEAHADEAHADEVHADEAGTSATQASGTGNATAPGATTAARASNGIASAGWDVLKGDKHSAPPPLPARGTVGVAAPVPAGSPSSNDFASARPAAQARFTADGLRKLTRRVPGAALEPEDGSLRRSTPTSTARNPLGVTGALSQYLSATSNDGHHDRAGAAEKEQDPR